MAGKNRRSKKTILLTQSITPARSNRPARATNGTSIYDQLESAGLAASQGKLSLKQISAESQAPTPTPISKVDSKTGSNPPAATPSPSPTPSPADGANLKSISNPPSAVPAPRPTPSPANETDREAISNPPFAAPAPSPTPSPTNGADRKTSNSMSAASTLRLAPSPVNEADRKAISNPMSAASTPCPILSPAQNLPPYFTFGPNVAPRVAVGPERASAALGVLPKVIAFQPQTSRQSLPLNTNLRNYLDPQASTFSPRSLPQVIPRTVLNPRAADFTRSLTPSPTPSVAPRATSDPQRAPMVVSSNQSYGRIHYDKNSADLGRLPFGSLSLLPVLPSFHAVFRTPLSPYVRPLVKDAFNPFKRARKGKAVERSKDFAFNKHKQAWKKAAMQQLRDTVSENQRPQRVIKPPFKIWPTWDVPYVNRDKSYKDMFEGIPAPEQSNLTPQPLQLPPQRLVPFRSLGFEQPKTHPQYFKPPAPQYLEETQFHLQRPLNVHFQLASPMIIKLAAEYGLPSPHSIITKADTQFRHISNLGHGSLGVVDEVEVYVGGLTKRLVRKMIRLAASNRERYMAIVKQEVEVMRALSHCHIVQVVGTYELRNQLRQSYAILMTPVGDRDLKHFLDEFFVRKNYYQDRQWLSQWFTCLASALAYIHSQGIRHEDIKPSNIIHRGGEIFLTDFSSCSRFDIDRTTSTGTPAERITRIYSAPEILQEGSRHGIGSDVFSMGCVFAEMATVLDNKDIDGLYKFCTVRDMGGASRMYSNVLDRLDYWFGDHGLYFFCIKPMLALDRKMRPPAFQVLERMRAYFPAPAADLKCGCHRNDTNAMLNTTMGGLLSIAEWDSALWGEDAEDAARIDSYLDSIT